MRGLPPHKMAENLSRTTLSFNEEYWVFDLVVLDILSDKQTLYLTFIGHEKKVSFSTFQFMFKIVFFSF